MTENQHTPTPWHVDNTGVVVGSRAPNGSTDLIADLHTSAMPSEARANAAFIVKACNNHQALVEALRRCREGLVCRVIPRLPIASCECWACETERQIKAALAAATEGTL